MQTLDPSLVSALAALSASVLMVHAGLGNASSRGGRPASHTAATKAAPPRQELDPGGRAEAPAARSEVDETQHQGQGAAGGTPRRERRVCR